MYTYSWGLYLHCISPGFLRIRTMIIDLEFSHVGSGPRAQVTAAPWPKWATIGCASLLGIKDHILEAICLVRAHTDTYMIWYVRFLYVYIYIYIDIHVYIYIYGIIWFKLFECPSFVGLPVTNTPEMTWLEEWGAEVTSHLTPGWQGEHQR